MAVSGVKKIEQEFENKLYVGQGLVDVISINPTSAELKKLGQYVDDEKDEIEYTKDKEGVKTVRLDFWLKEGTTGHIFKKSFFLENEDVYSEKTDKFQYVNQIGDSAWAQGDKPKFTEFFTNFKSKGELLGDKENRKAKKGEAELLDFLKKWLALDFYDPTATIMIDMAPLFKGKYKELQNLVGDDLAQPVIVFAGVKTTQEGKQYQSVWKTALPGANMKLLRNIDTSKKAMEKWMEKDALARQTKGKEGAYMKDYEKVLSEMMIGDYPYKDFFILQPFKEYDESANPVTSNDAKIEEKQLSTTGSDY